MSQCESKLVYVMFVCMYNVHTYVHIYIHITHIRRAGLVLGADTAGPGGVGCLNTPPPSPSNSAPGSQRHAVSGIRNEFKNHDEATFSLMSLFKVRSKVRSPEIIKGIILSFPTFYEKSAHNSGTRRATVPPKTAFDGSFNALSLWFPHI